MTQQDSTGRRGWLALLAFVLIPGRFAGFGLPAVLHAAGGETAQRMLGLLAARD